MGLLLADEPVTELGREVARVKRFLEWYGADPSVREAARTAPAALREKLGLDLDFIALRPLWDEEDRSASPLVAQYRDFIREKLEYRDQVRAVGSPALPRMRRWRERQIARCQWELPSGSHRSIVHAPLTLELCRGCSVGCWFCGVSAPKLTETWPHTEANAALWQGVLTEFGRVLGKAGEQAFCYWATDPLDNPDYEQFCLDFAAILGRFPQTTTALALKNVERTRKLLQLSRAHGCIVNRFSLLTLNQVRKVMQTFTAEELLYVELVLQNPESTAAKAAVGRARERETDTEGTIACVSGFHVNMVDRTVQLMTPCLASEAVPLGYHVLARGRFETLEDFRRLLDQMTSFAAMPDHLRLDQTLRFWPWLQYQAVENGFKVAAPYAEIVMQQNEYPALQSLGELIQEGHHSVAEVASRLEERVPLQDTFVMLEDLFASGLLVEATETVVLEVTNAA